MTQENPQVGDLFANDEKHEKRPESSWTYWLIARVQIMNPVTLEKEWGWRAIYGPGKTGGNLTRVSDKNMKRSNLRFVGAVPGDDLTDWEKFAKMVTGS